LQFPLVLNFEFSKIYGGEGLVASPPAGAHDENMDLRRVDEEANAENYMTRSIVGEM
jgi:hypothetical protein